MIKRVKDLKKNIFKVRINNDISLDKIFAKHIFSQCFCLCFFKQGDKTIVCLCPLRHLSPSWYHGGRCFTHSKARVPSAGLTHLVIPLPNGVPQVGGREPLVAGSARAVPPCRELWGTKGKANGKKETTLPFLISDLPWVVRASPSGKLAGGQLPRDIWSRLSELNVLRKQYLCIPQNNLKVRRWKIFRCTKKKLLENGFFFDVSHFADACKRGVRHELSLPPAAVLAPKSVFLLLLTC